MQKISLLILIIFLSGCVAQSKNLCKEYGFISGTRDFANCVVMETHRAQDAWSDYADQMEANRQPKPSLSCKTTPNSRYNIFGNGTLRGTTLYGSTTVCE